MKLIFSLLFISIFTVTSASAACIPPSYAEGRVAGKEYIFQKSRNPDNPVILRFGFGNDAEFGNHSDEPERGIYSYRGDCHARIKVYFLSYTSETGIPELLFHLKPAAVGFEKLVDLYDDENIFLLDSRN